jgi:hypothetical protein
LRKRANGSETNHPSYRQDENSFIESETLDGRQVHKCSETYGQGVSVWLHVAWYKDVPLEKRQAVKDTIFFRQLQELRRNGLTRGFPNLAT